MEYQKYHNCLRIQLTQDDFVQERIDDMVVHCLTYGFDNVMLMMNAEEFNVGHITLEEAKPWVAILKRAKVALESAGITVSVNNWMEIGHVGRGRKLKNGQNFMTMVDRNGVVNDFCVCPLDEEWRKYFSDYVKLLVKELEPDTFWIEDDFRLHNHPPMTGIGCFCEKHMAYYNEKLGTSYSREEFVSKIFAQGPLTKEREVWLDANRDTMLSTAEFIVKAVKEACPTTEVAIMSSGPNVHCVEARDWKKLLDILSTGTGNRINRIHLPCYEEQSGKDFFWHFNSISLPVRALSGSDAIIMPEMENGATSLYRKSARFFRFVLETATPLVLSGMTYSLYDFVSHGVRDSFGFGREVAFLQPYMQAIEDLQLNFDTLSGVVVPVDGRAAYKKCIENDGYRDLLPWEYQIGGYLSGMGVSYRYSEEKSFAGRTVFLCASSADYFTDEEMKALFANNFVLLEGSGVLALQKRGLQGLIGFTHAEVKAAESGYHTYEECRGAVCIDGVRGLRASCRLAAGDFVKIDYNGEICVHTDVYNERRERLAAGIVEGKNFAVIPYILNKKLFSQFCDLRRHFLLDILQRNMDGGVLCETAGMGAYVYREKKRTVVILVNANVDNYDRISLRMPAISFFKLSVLEKDGKVYPLAYKKEGEHIIIDHKMEYLSSLLLIAE